jgi:hypothetical protein
LVAVNTEFSRGLLEFALVPFDKGPFSVLCLEIRPGTSDGTRDVVFLVGFLIPNVHDEGAFFAVFFEGFDVYEYLLV